MGLVKITVLSAIGRFVSPDTVVPNEKNPQALNRYAYTFNNPVRYVDPSGHDPLDAAWEAEWAANHPGQTLTDADRIDRLNSIMLANGRAWTDDDWQRYTEAKQSGALNPMDVLKGTSGSLAQRIGLASAFVTLAASGPVGGWIYKQFIGGGGSVQYGGGPFRRAGTAIGWNGVVYLDESWRDWSAAITAAYIAHESYHAQMSIVRYPYSRGEEVQAFTREAAVWNELRVTYSGPRDSNYYRRETILIYSQRPGGLEYFVNTDPFYTRPPFTP